MSKEVKTVIGELVDHFDDQTIFILLTKEKRELG